LLGEDGFEILLYLNLVWEYKKSKKISFAVTLMVFDLFSVCNLFWISPRTYRDLELLILELLPFGGFSTLFDRTSLIQHK
jgi:hypothetical protein